MNNVNNKVKINNNNNNNKQNNKKYKRTAIQKNI